MKKGFVFKMTRFEDAVARARTTHPWTEGNSWESPTPTGVYGERLADLRQTLLTTPQENLLPWADSLSMVERNLLARCCLDSTTKIRHKVLWLFIKRPGLVNLQLLRKAFAEHALSEEGIHINRLLESTEHALPHPDSSWLHLLEDHAQHQEQCGIHWVATMTQQNQPLRELLDSMGLGLESVLHQRFQIGVLYGGPGAWQLHGVSWALAGMRHGATEDRVTGLRFAYAAHRHPQHWEVVDSFVQRESVSELLQEDQNLRQALRTNWPEVWGWLQQFILQAFFGQEPSGYNQERYAFWKKYASCIHDMHINRQAGRIFMNFGLVGVVEFLEVGNATYIYDTHQYQKMVILDLKQPTNPHHDFKSWDRIDKWSHTRNWPRKFEVSLRAYEIYPLDGGR